MVSQENVQLLREVYREWSAGNYAAGRELLDPSLVTVWEEQFPTAGTYSGPAAHAEAMREWLAAWDEFSLEPEDFFDAGDSIVVPFVVHARGRESGVSVERRWAHVWTLRDGHVVRFEVHLDVASALRAVGLDEQ